MKKLLICVAHVLVGMMCGAVMAWAQSTDSTSTASAWCLTATGDAVPCGVVISVNSYNGVDSPPGAIDYPSIICSIDPVAPFDPVNLLKWRWEQLAEDRRSQEHIIHSWLKNPDRYDAKKAVTDIEADAIQMSVLEAAIHKLQSSK